MENYTIKQLHEGYKKKEFKVEEIISSYLNNIHNSKLNSHLSIFDDAIEEAKRIDQKIEKGESLYILDGIPVSIKDNILIKDKKCTAASKILENYVAPYSATVINRLSGSVFLGKTNMDEFAMGSSTENSAFGVVKNPINHDYVPGGSSGGSTAAVRGNECVYALGSDTGGSIRQPASFCGVVGLKPTYGAVSRYGLMAFASSLDQIGPITKNIEDAEIIFNEIKGKDKKDSTSVDYNSREDKKEIIIGIPKEFYEGVDQEIKNKILGIVKKMHGSGVRFEKVSLPHMKYALPAYYIIAPSEASSNLARYDGVKYGLGMEFTSDLDLIGEYKNTREKGFGPEVKRRIMLGTYALSSGYYDAYYIKAQKVRTKIKEDFDKVFKKVDLLITPTSPFLPFKIGEKINDPMKMYMSDILTVSVNIAGLPAISMPVGDIDGLSVGLQIIGNYFGENQIFNLARKIEKL